MGVHISRGGGVVGQKGHYYINLVAAFPRQGGSLKLLQDFPACWEQGGGYTEAEGMEAEGMEAEGM